MTVRLGKKVGHESVLDGCAAPRDPGFNPNSPVIHGKPTGQTDASEKPEVVKLASGVQYVDLRIGGGEARRPSPRLLLKACEQGETQ